MNVCFELKKKNIMKMSISMILILNCQRQYYVKTFPINVTVKHNAHLQCKCDAKLWFYVVILCERDPQPFLFTDVRYVATMPLIRFQTAILSRSIREISWAEKQRDWIRQKTMVVALYALSRLNIFLFFREKCIARVEKCRFCRVWCNLTARILAHV